MSKKKFIYGLITVLIIIAFATGYSIGNKVSLETQKEIEEIQKE